MSNRLMRTLASCVIATVLTTRAAAEDPLTAARDLYASAAYEDALSVLNGLRTSAHRPEDDRVIEQYRAFCLLALGRAAEGERAIEAVVEATPSFRPSDADASPRMRTAFRDVRRRMLPAIIQRKFEEAKGAFDRKDFVHAQQGFSLVLELISDSDVGPAASQSPMSEMRTLALGFRDLSTTRAAPPPMAAQLPRPVVPAPAPIAAQLPRPVVPAPASADAAPSRRPIAGRVYTSDDPNVVPPVVVRQSLAALADVFAPRSGILEITIDEAGVVVSAAMTMSVNDVYDRLAVATAKSWRYRPATLDGVPVRFRTSIQLDLKRSR